MVIEVLHPWFGRGRVLTRQHGGYRLQVLFEDQKTRWVTIDEVQPVHRAQPDRSLQQVPNTPDSVRHANQHDGMSQAAATPIVHHHGDLPATDPYFPARAMVEAFRMGIVPYDRVADFTFGRDKELAEVSHWLGRQRRSSLVLLGDYGTGKTHLIESILGRGLEAGYVVARAEIDPSERPFHKPKRVYARLVETLRWRDDAGQIRRFDDLVRTAAQTGAWQEHTFFKHVTPENDGAALWDWLEARATVPRPWHSPSAMYWQTQASFPPLYDYSNAGNLYSYLLSAVSWAAKELLGRQGLLLVFDEAEAIDWSYTNYQTGMGHNFLRALLRCGANDESLLDPRTAANLEPTRQRIAKEVPFIYRVPTGLKLAFAFTSLDWNEIETWNGVARRIPELEQAAQISLESLQPDALHDVGFEIRRLYETAYPDRAVRGFDPSLVLREGDPSITRLFVKAAVEALDLLRHYPDRAPETLFR
jgi:hypothetical protein